MKVLMGVASDAIEHMRSLIRSAGRETKLIHDMNHHPTTVEAISME